MENSTNTTAHDASNVAERSCIKVFLRKNATGNDVLHFEGAPDNLDIDFSNSDQSSLRELFCWLLDKQLEQRTNLQLVKDSSVKNDTYKKVAEDYVQDLNGEIDSLFVNEALAIKDLTGEIVLQENEGSLTD